MLLGGEVICVDLNMQAMTWLTEAGKDSHNRLCHIANTSEARFPIKKQSETRSCTDISNLSLQEALMAL